MHSSKRLLVLTALGLVTFVGMLALAYWQFGKGLDKYWLIQENTWHPQKLSIHDLQKKKAPPTGKTQLELSTGQHLPIFHGYGYIISGQLRGKKSGYEVFAVLHSESAQSDLLVALGWRESQAHARALLQAINFEQPMIGYFHKPSGKLWVQHPRQSTTANVQYLSYLDMPTITGHHPRMYPYVFYTLDSSMGQLMQEPTYFEKKMFKHISYALQFIVFGLLTLVYTVIFTLKRAPHATAKPK